MKFFVPTATDDKIAEDIYKAIAKFVKAPVKSDRIWKLKWRHNGMSMECEVGGKMPDYYRTGEDIVLAIFDTGTLYFICTVNRGGRRGEPILAGKDGFSQATCFDQ